MEARRSKAESATSWWTHRVWCSKPAFTAHRSRTLRGHQNLARTGAGSLLTAPLSPVDHGRRLHRRRQGCRLLGREGTGLDGTDRSPPSEDSSGRSDEDMGEGVGQRGRGRRLEEAAAKGLQGLLAEEVGSGAHLVSWLGQNRRMSKDYERLAATSEAFVYVAMSRLMVRRLARS
jgi:hypothetical protein